MYRSTLSVAHENHRGRLPGKVGRLAHAWWPACVLLWVFASSVSAELPASEPGRPGPEKKIISFRGPSARGLALNIEKMEKMLPGIDGVALYPTTYYDGKGTEAVGRMFRKDWHRIEQFEPAIEHLQASEGQEVQTQFPAGIHHHGQQDQRGARLVR